MRVISKDEVERKHKCSKCNCIFAYKLEEVDNFLYRSVRCPNCKQIENVSWKDKKVKKI